MFFLFLINGLAQPFKAVEQFLIVNLVVNVEAIPQITADDHTAETQILGLLHVVEVHAADGIHLLVNQSLARSLLQFVVSERRFLLWMGLTVVDAMQEYSFSSLMAWQVRERFPL